MELRKCVDGPKGESSGLGWAEGKVYKNNADYTIPQSKIGGQGQGGVKPKTAHISKKRF